MEQLWQKQQSDINDPKIFITDNIVKDVGFKMKNKNNTSVIIEENENDCLSEIENSDFSLMEESTLNESGGQKNSLS